MAEINERDERSAEGDQVAEAEAQDLRREYEPPRIVKKRSIARATLFTGMGPMGTLTAMG